MCLPVPSRHDCLVNQQKQHSRSTTNSSMMYKLQKTKSTILKVINISWLGLTLDLFTSVGPWKLVSPTKQEWKVSQRNCLFACSTLAWWPKWLWSMSALQKWHSSWTSNSILRKQTIENNQCFAVVPHFGLWTQLGSCASVVPHFELWTHLCLGCASVVPRLCLSCASKLGQ